MSSADRTLQEIVRRIMYLESRERARMSEWLELVAEFDRRDGPRRTGFATTAEWLAFTCDIEARTARDYVRVARRLREMPAVAGAFGEGRLSYSQVRAISRAEPSEDESDLLRVALTSTVRALEHHVRQLRSSRCADLDVANRGRAKRFVSFFPQEDGSVRFFGRLPAPEGTAVTEAVETVAARLHANADDPCCAAEGWRRPPIGARRADALVELITAGKGLPTHLVLHADPEALACHATGNQPRSGETLYLQDGPAIPSELARRLACDCVISFDDLNHGRRQRLVSSAQRRALELRDGRKCVMPGCERTHGLQAHHIEHWIHGGATDLDNLAQFCAFHHPLFHEHGFTIRRNRDGTFTINDPHGRELYRVAPRASPVLAAA